MSKTRETYKYITIFKSVRYILALMLVLIFSSTQALAASCDKPITFRIGSVDRRFDLSRDLASSTLSSVIQSWNTALNRDVAKYEPIAGKVSINFIYDKRQSETIDRNIKEQELNEEAITLKRKLDALNSKKSNFEQLKNSFESDARSFEFKLAQYNEMVRNANLNGGADFNIFKVLSQNKSELISKSAELTERQTRLQNQIDSINSEVDSYNREVNRLNTFVITLNKSASKIF